ncbi:alpha/beta hydrolase [Rhizobium sp. 3T7]|uniref:alpha/beta fold hydrolase n=1 Tax=Rhizobium sp. 3T7 TaxID=2874922 RepID=UPI001CC9AAAF|nr:alpha/beta hydrolase [Rhizobium sp. 3T7]MBZ9791124.1 alpha/beta hydrolase [Rhizobium sp. 3T7]
MNIILLPGFMTDASLWDDLLPTLQAIARVKAIDLSGATTMAEMADLVLAEGPDTFVLIGFSMGGYVAREVVRKSPERVTALILIATSARGDTDEQAKGKKFSVKLVDPERFHGLSRGAIISSLHQSRSSDEAMIQRVRTMSEHVGADVFIRHANEARGGDLERLHAITCPSLVIAADGDRLRTLDEARELVHGIVGSSLIVIEGSGHMIPIEQPQALTDAIIPWLEKLKDRAPR